MKQTKSAIRLLQRTRLREPRCLAIGNDKKFYSWIIKIVGRSPIFLFAVDNLAALLKLLPPSVNMEVIKQYSSRDINRIYDLERKQNSIINSAD